MAGGGVNEISRKPVGVLGWNAKERAEYARTGQWPERTVEAPNKPPPGLSLSSVPDLFVQSPAEPFEGTLSEALLILAADALKRPKPGPKKADQDVLLILECLRKAEDNETEARQLFANQVQATYPVASKRFTKGMKHVRELKCARKKSFASLLAIFNASEKCN